MAMASFDTRESSVNDAPVCVSKAKICDRDRRVPCTSMSTVSCRPDPTESRKDVWRNCSARPPDEEISDQTSRHENLGSERIRFDLLGRAAPDFGAFAPDQGQIAVIDDVRVENVMTHLMEGGLSAAGEGELPGNHDPAPALDRGYPPFGDRRADAVRSLG